jgi:hypothetical protein
MIKSLAGRLYRRLSGPALPAAAAAARRADRAGLPDSDPGIDRAVDEAVAWLGRAQDHSATRDGGVARHYCLRTGWGSSYPETTGYLVPTLLDVARGRDDHVADDARRRARMMLDWLASIQHPSGGFQGGMVDQTPVVPVTFNTGQILLGLAAGVREFGEAFAGPMSRAADWLVATQDPDGCWRRHPTPFAAPGEKVYETHVAWGLLEADRVRPDSRYRDAALANIRWALEWQRENGWFDRCCLEEPTQPLTHTIGYVLRGVLEGYRASGDPALMASARRLADGLITALRPDGFLPGRLDARWRGTVRWACLTGSVQVAHCWLMIHQETGDPRYRDAAFLANRYVRRTVAVDGAPGTRGGVKGSFPIDGGYGTYQYLNWACKFFIDANRLEACVRRAAGSCQAEAATSDRRRGASIVT